MPAQPTNWGASNVNENRRAPESTDAQLARQPSSAGVTSRGQQHAVCMKPATTATGHHEPTADVAGHGPTAEPVIS